MDRVIEWLLASGEPWTRYRTLVDLLDWTEDNSTVQDARTEMLAHSQVRSLVDHASTWGERPLKRHNDASHPIYAFSTLADMGVRAGDEGMATAVEGVLEHQSPEGAFQTILNIPTRFGGTGRDQWTWIACDAPVLLYALLAMGLGDDPRVTQAAEHLADLAQDNGWRCAGSPKVGRFRGPGRKGDPCPMANLVALKALAQMPDLVDSPAARTGAEMLLWHWENQRERKLYLFGIGTDFRRLKVPFVWYDILHVVDVLSRFPFLRTDPRFQEMVATIKAQADEGSHFTAGSMYQAWKGWSFADKKVPSPWLTFLCHRVLSRIHQAGS